MLWWAVLDAIQMGCTEQQMKIDGIDSVTMHCLSKVKMQNKRQEISVIVANA